jgi:hypothetical protein
MMGYMNPPVLIAGRSLIPAEPGPAFSLDKPEGVSLPSGDNFKKPGDISVSQDLRPNN